MLKYYDKVETIESETEGRRYVDPASGALYPSITTVLSHYFSKQYENFENKELLNHLRDRGGRYGNILHSYAEGYILKKQNNEDHVGKALFEPIRDYVDNNLTKVYATEKVVLDHETRTAGRFDCFGNWKGVDSVIDFKNSRTNKDKRDIPNYFIQMAFYAKCLQVNNGIILMSIEDAAQGKCFIEPDLHKYYPAFLKLRKYFLAKQGF